MLQTIPAATPQAITANPRQEAIRDARRHLTAAPLYLDTETTGLDGEAEIVELCLIDAAGRPVVNSLVRPSVSIPPGATAVHGITDAMVARAPTWDVLWPEVEAAIDGRRVGIYNADYDLRLIRQCNERHGLVRRRQSARAFCIMLLYARYVGEKKSDRNEYRWHKLEAAGRACKIDLPNAHRALADTLLARAVLQHVAAQP